MVLQAAAAKPQPSLFSPGRPRAEAEVASPSLEILAPGAVSPLAIPTAPEGVIVRQSRPQQFPVSSLAVAVPSQDDSPCAQASPSPPQQQQQQQELLVLSESIPPFPSGSLLMMLGAEAAQTSETMRQLFGGFNPDAETLVPQSVAEPPALEGEAIPDQQQLLQQLQQQLQAHLRLFDLQQQREQELRLRHGPQPPPAATSSHENPDS